MSKQPPNVPTQPARRSFLQRASVVWIIPLIALVIALGVAWQSYSERGPVIQVSFTSAEGVKAGQTELKYRDVTVGLVEKVSFTDDLTSVVLDIRLDKEVGPFVDTTATFWVVSPQVSARGISGLGTVLSGVYVEGSWDSEPDGLEYEFLGLESAPLIRSGERGLQIALRSSGSGALGENTPILFRGVEVGRMGQAVISKDGGFTIAEAIIYAPHDRLISPTTRFWDTSGFTFSIGASGAELDFSSIATLIGGGITFETLVSSDEPAIDGTVFEVYDSAADAKASIYNATDVQALEVSAIFEDNIAGLAVGAAVELGGFKIGEVTSLNGVVDRTKFGDARVRLNATLSIQPARLGLPGEVTPEAALEFLNEQVTVSNLRARLASASLLTGGLKVELIEAEGAAIRTMNMDSTPFPTIPVTDSEITDVSATAEGVLSRINNLPVEELMGEAIAFLDAARAFVNSEELREAPAEVVGLLSDMRGLVSSDAAQNVPVALNAALSEVQGLLARLGEEQAVARLTSALEAVSAAATKISDGTETLPALFAQFEALAAKATDLPLDEFLNETRALIQSANTLVGSDAVAEVPTALSGALSEVSQTLESLRAENGVARLLASVDAVTAAANQANTSVAGLPDLIDQLNTVATRVADVPVNEVADQLSTLLGSANAVLDTPDARQLPSSLSAALGELQATLTELREGGAVENVNKTLQSASTAADQIAVSVQDLPGLIARMTRLLNEASGTLQSYDGRSEINRGARDALRDIAEAAEAVSSLARTIERNPNSLLLGR